ncbi:MAG: DUF1501 domain-containing protein [Pedosphaera sp.]|nr:DUF1501 domain-containing protein [Pedosphaera sp.]
MLSELGTGLGSLGLVGLLGDARMLASSPLSARPAPFRPRAKHIIHIYLNGGPSQVDTFDPKPMLARYTGKTIPTGNLSTERQTGSALPSPFKFNRCGRSGLEISEIFPGLSRHADDLCVIRSMHANTPNHEQSMRLMNCGDERLARPSYGAWITYGMGTENQNLPAFIAMCPGLPVADVSNWRSAFLPGIYQGTHIDTRKEKPEELIENIVNRSVTPTAQRRQLDLLAGFNAAHQQVRSGDPDIEARIQSFELAYRMQLAATDAFDISRESQNIRDLYGSSVQSRQLLIARRLIERGVRVVQCYHGDVQPWDSHNLIEKEHRRLAGQVDPGIGALLDDLKQRGLFDETLVIIGGEFGRTPAVEVPTPGTPGGGLGRDHNHWGFSVVLAGSGVRGGMAYGATDDFGYRAVQNPVHIHDLHATVLHLMGFDHEKLTYRHAGRDFRLTDVSGEIIRPILA